MMVKQPLYYFLNVSNFFNYLTAIFLLSPRTDIGCENYNKNPSQNRANQHRLERGYERVCLEFIS